MGGVAGLERHANGNNIFDKFYVGPELNVGLKRQINITYKIDFK